MTIEPWRATCIQTISRLAVKAPHRDSAWAIINENIGHALALIDATTQTADPPKLVVLPEFAFSGASARSDGCRLDRKGVLPNSRPHHRAVAEPGPPAAHLYRSPSVRERPRMAGPVLQYKFSFVRAAENMVFVISANVAGGIGFSLDGSVPGGRSHIIDYLGRTLAYQDGAGETTAVSALIDVEALRAERKKDTGTVNPLLRARWEMYRPFFGTTSFYPPNSFLDAPISDAASAKPAIAASLRNMVKAGVIVDA